jgi:SAM-dependent methyltransferase
MGIDYNGARLLAFCKRAGVDFRATAMIGRQTLDARPHELRRIFGFSGLPQPGYSEPLFEALGAKTIDSIDVNGYEQATILHNMNEPIPARLRERFSVVIDGGALEHIFNFPTAIQNCMDMVAPGGHFVAGVPANNFTGHGFYQFSPELYYRVLSDRYGFAMREMFLATRLGRGKWLRVADPAAIRRRVIFSNWLETSLYVVARKVRTVHMDMPPYQSDYEMLEWRNGMPQAAPRGNIVAKIRRSVVRSLPLGLADQARNTRERLRFLTGQFGRMEGLEKVVIENLPG